MFLPLSVCLSVCFSVCLIYYSNSYEQILTEFFEVTADRDEEQFVRFGGTLSHDPVP